MFLSSGPASAGSFSPSSSERKESHSRSSSATGAPQPAIKAGHLAYTCKFILAHTPGLRKPQTPHPLPTADGPLLHHLQARGICHALPDDLHPCAPRATSCPWISRRSSSSTRPAPASASKTTPDTPCVRANRLLLRQLLSTHIPIQWGKQATRIDEEEAAVTVHFGDGTAATGDILVGADGTWSKGLSPPPPPPPPPLSPSLISFPPLRSKTRASDIC